MSGPSERDEIATLGTFLAGLVDGAVDELAAAIVASGWLAERDRRTAATAVGKVTCERDELAATVTEPLRSDHPAIIDAEKRGHERGWNAATEEFSAQLAALHHAAVVALIMTGTHTTATAEERLAEASNHEGVLRRRDAAVAAQALRTQADRIDRAHDSSHRDGCKCHLVSAYLRASADRTNSQTEDRVDVHNHGTEDGPGLACRETRQPDGSLRGACMDGLHDKYRVERLGDDGKHDDCRYFVLDPQHDPVAREALALYAGRTGNADMRNDLRAWLDELGDDHA